MELHSLTLAVLQVSLQARAVPEMHDRLIVAAGLLLQNQGEQVAILTKDVSITTAALLPIIWNWLRSFGWDELPTCPTQNVFQPLPHITLESLQPPASVSANP